MKRWLLYVVRWQASAVVMAPFMWALEPRIGATPALFACQFVGALIFYKIDKGIFR